MERLKTFDVNRKGEKMEIVETVERRQEVMFDETTLKNRMEAHKRNAQHYQSLADAELEKARKYEQLLTELNNTSVEEV